MTILGDALKKAGVNTDAALLRAVAVDCLRKADLSPRRALAEFVSEVRDAGGMMAALHPKRDTEEVGIIYLQRVAADMRGDSLKNPAKAGVGGHAPSASNGRNRPAPDKIPERSGAGGHSRNAHDGRAWVAPGEVSAKAEGAGRVICASDGRSVTARPTVSPQGEADGRSRSASNGRAPCAIGHNSGAMAKHTVPEMVNVGLPSSGSPSRGEAEDAMPETAGRTLPSPGSPRGSAALKAIAKAIPSIFDSYKLSDGTKIGDVRYSQLSGIFTRSARDAAIIWVIRNAGVPADQNMRVRDYLSAKQIDEAEIAKAQTLIEHAAEK